MKSNIKQILLYLLSSLLGCFFLFSAYTKTQPVQDFEYTIYTQLHLPQLLSAYAARFFIGLEAALGLLLLLNIYGKRKWVILMSFWLLIAFTIHLGILYLNSGNDVNCGCMGSMVPMTPLDSILKNIVLLALFGVLWKFSPRQDSSSWQQILSFVIIPVVIAVPYVFFPSQIRHIPMSQLYGQEAHHTPQDNLAQGKHFIGFLSMTCSHCRDAARDLSKMKISNPDLPIHLVLLDPEKDSLRTEMYTDFIADTKAEHIPYSFLGQKAFKDIAGNYVPAMFWVKDSTIIKKIEVPNLNQKELELWIQSAE